MSNALELAFEIAKQEERDKHARNLDRAHTLRQKIFSEFPMLAVK